MIYCIVESHICEYDCISCGGKIERCFTSKQAAKKSIWSKEKDYEIQKVELSKIPVRKKEMI